MWYPRPDNAESAVRFRRGWFLGDGTGAGKGRQVAGVLLDNWLKGRRRAVWVSKSDKLIEDAQRDWWALGQERLLITPLSRFRQGTPIALEQGVLFTTYSTLRSDAREERVSRVRQIVDWLGSGFDGVIVFDESHAMQNAGGGKSEHGDQAPSQQGRAGLRLQHALPNARVLYVSATGASTCADRRARQSRILLSSAAAVFDGNRMGAVMVSITASPSGTNSDRAACKPPTSLSATLSNRKRGFVRSPRSAILWLIAVTSTAIRFPAIVT